MTNQMPELWICERKAHLPEHDGATGYFYYEPVKPYTTDLAQKTVTREEVMKIALESGIMLSTQYGQANGKLMPVSDTKTLLRFAKSLISAGIVKVSD